MNYGLYLSASGLLTNTYRQDVFANNLANVNTVAFKPDVASVRARPTASVEDAAEMDVSRQLMDALGGGVLAAPQKTAFTPGPMQQTGSPMDAYITDERGFFAVRTADENGDAVIRLTRDGRFMVDADGRVVTPNGDAVLDDGGKPVSVPEGVLPSITANGDLIDQNNQVIGRIGVQRVADFDDLHKVGNNLFAVRPGASVEAIDRPTLKPGVLEGSGADPISTLMQLIAATKAATGNANLIRYHDTLMDRAINTLGRVA